jgi:hypothetical protein
VVKNFFGAASFGDGTKIYPRHNPSARQFACAVTATPIIAAIIIARHPGQDDAA